MIIGKLTPVIRIRPPNPLALLPVSAIGPVLRFEPTTTPAEKSRDLITTTPDQSPRKREGAVGKEKRCSKCGEKKSIEEFPPHNTSADGHAAYCRNCKNDLAKERRLKDPLARIRHYTVTRIKNEFAKKDIPNDVHTALETYLGYQLHELVKVLREDLSAREGITLYEAFKRGYHLDHIRPHSSFAIEAIGDEEFKRCWAIGNLRLIPSTENLQKGAKIIDVEA